MNGATLARSDSTRTWTHSCSLPIGDQSQENYSVVHYRTGRRERLWNVSVPRTNSCAPIFLAHCHPTDIADFAINIDCVSLANSIRHLENCKFKKQAVISPFVSFVMVAAHDLTF